MKSITIHCMCIILLTLLSRTEVGAQVSFPYYTGFDNATEKADWTLYRTGFGGNYIWQYASDMSYSAPECLMHLYPVNGNMVTDDWFVSPLFDFSSGGNIDSVRHYFSGFSTPFPDDTVGIYLLVGSPDPQLAMARILLKDFRGADYVNDGIWNLTQNISIPSTSGDCYIAFRYRTIVSWLDVRFDNLMVNGTNPPPTGIEEAQAESGKIRLFPNPAQELLNISSAVPYSTITVRDITGKEVIHQLFSQAINVSRLNAGIYFMQCFSEQRGSESVMFIKK